MLRSIINGSSSGVERWHGPLSSRIHSGIRHANARLPLLIFNQPTMNGIRKGVRGPFRGTVENRMFSPERHREVLERVSRKGTGSAFERMPLKPGDG